MFDDINILMNSYCSCLSISNYKFSPGKVLKLAKFFLGLERPGEISYFLSAQGKISQPNCWLPQTPAGTFPYTASGGTEGNSWT